MFAAKKEKNYMFLSTSKFKFLDVKNYIGPGLSYDAWCKSMGCRLKKLMFPYEWLDGYEKLSHVGSVSYEGFYSGVKSTIRSDAYEQFLKLFKKNDCTTITLLMLFHLLRPLGGWSSNTILIKLMHAKTQLASQAYQ